MELTPGEDQRHRPAEHEMRRQRHPPGKLGIVDDPVATEEERLEPGNQAVEVDEPDDDRDRTGPGEPSREPRLDGIFPQHHLENDPQEHPGGDVEHAPHRQCQRVVEGRVERLSAETERQKDADQLEGILAGERRADDVEHQARQRPHDAEEEPRRGVVREVVALVGPVVAGHAVPLEAGVDGGIEFRFEPRRLGAELGEPGTLRGEGFTAHGFRLSRGRDRLPSRETTGQQHGDRGRRPESRRLPLAPPAPHASGAPRRSPPAPPRESRCSRSLR